MIAKRRRAFARICVALLFGGATPAVAGPPYQTDDPEPTALHHWEIYNFIEFDGVAAHFQGEGGLDLNYGAAKDLQLTATLPLAFSHASGEGWRTGRGEVELAAKYRFVNDEKSGWQAAVFPRAILPTASRSLGGTRTRLLLPVWVQKDFGKTAVFGGGGFEINPGSGNRNFWQAGIAVTHDVRKTLQIGSEISWQSADTRGGKAAASLGIGAIRQLGGPFALLVAGGPSLSGGSAGYRAYAALGLNF